jgi:hypothetical protein
VSDSPKRAGFARPRIIVFAAAVVVASVTILATASAAPITGGKTVLKPDQDTFEALADMSIGVEPTGAAKLGNNGFKFPISGGKLSQSGKTVIDHRGGIAFFTEGGGSVKFSKLEAQAGANKVKVFAKSDHSEVRFLDVKGGKVSGTDTSLTVKGAKASLAKPGAAILSEVFDTDIQKGVPVGVFNVKATIGG